MGVIDLSTRNVIRVCKDMANENILLAQDAVDGKEYLMTLESGVLTFTNIADDTEVLSFSPDA